MGGYIFSRQKAAYGLSRHQIAHGRDLVMHVFFKISAFGVQQSIGGIKGIMQPLHLLRA